MVTINSVSIVVKRLENHSAKILKDALSKVAACTAAKNANERYGCPL
jgi:hypothetical protein